MKGISKMNLKRILFIISIGLLISACSSIEVGKEFSGREVTVTHDKSIAHINANNYGYYLFSIIPVWTGNVEGERKGSKFFKNNVTIDEVVNMVTKKSSELGANRIISLESTKTLTGGFSFWIIWFKQVQVSGTAVK